MDRVQNLFLQKIAFIRERVCVLAHRPLTEDDIVALGEIGMTRSPSAAIRFSALWLSLHRPDLYRDQMLTTAIGQAVRWIAAAKRDEGEAAARALVEKWEEGL